MAKGTLRSVGDLVSEGLVPTDEAASITAVAERYAIALTPTVRALIDTTAPNDPIAAQYVPSAAELVEHPGERPDRSAIIRIRLSKASFTAIPTGYC